ncbi:MAG: hotdog fold thioesterase [Deltaproteobacteria bacterium]|nr:hotdog fold thioesterase [Deltaproteobacteria bacterium]
MDDYVRNSLGSLQGGMTAFLADLAGQYAAREATGKSGQTRDLVIHYMSPGVTGPFQTTAEVLRMDHHSALTRIRVVDQGNDYRLMAVVLNSVKLSDE